MATNSTEVTKAIEGIASISEQNGACTEEVSASAEEMGAQVQEVVTSAQSHTQMSGDLQGVVGRFKLNNSDSDVATKERTAQPKENVNID